MKDTEHIDLTQVPGDALAAEMQRREAEARGQQQEEEAAERAERAARRGRLREALPHILPFMRHDYPTRGCVEGGTVNSGFHEEHDVCTKCTLQDWLDDRSLDTSVYDIYIDLRFIFNFHE